MSQQGFINPEYKPHKDLGAVTFTDAEWDTLKAKVTTFLTDNADKATLTVADARKVDDAFLDDRVWNQAAGELGLSEIVVP